MTSVLLDTNVMEPFEIAARLDVWLGHPKICDQMRQRKERAWCAAQIAKTLEFDPNLAAKLRSRYPRYGSAARRHSLSRLDYQRERGLRAGAAILPFLKEAATGEQPQFNGGPCRPTQDMAVRYLWKNRLPDESAIGFADSVHQIKKRELRDWYPVAHLAAAFQYMAREMSGPAKSASYDPQDIDFLKRWVALARLYAEIIRSLSALNTMADQIVDFIWIEGDDESENCP